MTYCISVSEKENSMIKVIESKQNNKIKHATSLKESKYRKEYKEFLSEGFNNLEMAAKSGCIKEIFTLKEIKGIPSDIVQYIVSENVLKKISSSKNPEGVIFVSCIVERKPKTLKKVVYLDHVSDPGNVGTILRTALAFDYDAVIFSDGCCDPYNEKVVSASKGAIYCLPILHGDLDKFRKDKTVIVSALTGKAVDIDKVETPKEFILVLGNEANGVSQSIIDDADLVTIIPIHNIDSLNVSVAAGILMQKLK